MAAQISWDEFKVDLRQLHDAIGAVQRERDTINETMASIGTEFNRVKEAWVTPAEQSFDAVQAWLMRVTHDLENILDDSIRRMQVAYENYLETEEKNTKNVTPHGGGGGGSSHKNGGSSHEHNKARYASGGHLAPATPRVPAGLAGGTTLKLRGGASPLEPGVPKVNPSPPSSR